MMIETKARQLHSQAEEAREKGDFSQALVYTDQALIEYQEEGDKLGFSEVVASRFLTLRHLWEKTNDRQYLILAKYTAQSAVELAEISGDKKALALPYFNLAKILETMEDYQTASEIYKKAIENIINNPPERHNRSAVVADFQAHQAINDYKVGDKTSLSKAEAAVAIIMTGDEPAYNKDVWSSGIYMRLAEAIKNDEPNKARSYMEKAKKIIDANPDLQLRRQQWEKIMLAFK